MKGLLAVLILTLLLVFCVARFIDRAQKDLSQGLQKFMEVR